MTNYTSESISVITPILIFSNNMEFLRKTPNGIWLKPD